MEKDMTLEENRRREESRVVGKEMTFSRKKKNSFLRWSAYCVLETKIRDDG